MGYGKAEREMRDQCCKEETKGKILSNADSMGGGGGIAQNQDQIQIQIQRHRRI